MKNNNNDNKILLWDDEYNNRVNDYMGEKKSQAVRGNETDLEDTNDNLIDSCTLPEDWINHSNDNTAFDDGVISCCRFPNNWLNDDNDLNGDLRCLPIEMLPILLVIDLSKLKEFSVFRRLERLKSILEDDQLNLNILKNNRYMIYVNTIILTPYESYVNHFVSLDEWNPYDIFISTKSDNVSREYIYGDNPYLEVSSYLKSMNSVFSGIGMYHEPCVIVLSNGWNDSDIQQIEEARFNMGKKRRIYVSQEEIHTCADDYEYCSESNTRNIVRLRDDIIPNMIMNHFVFWDEDDFGEPDFPDNAVTIIPDDWANG